MSVHSGVERLLIDTAIDLPECYWRSEKDTPTGSIFIDFGYQLHFSVYRHWTGTVELVVSFANAFDFATDLTTDFISPPEISIIKPHEIEYFWELGEEF